MRTPRGEIKWHLVPLPILLLAFLLLLLELSARLDLNGQLAQEARNGLPYAGVAAERPGVDGRLLGRHFSAATGTVGLLAGAHLLVLLLESREQRGVHVGDLQLLSGRRRSGAIRDLREIIRKKIRRRLDRRFKLNVMQSQAARL